MREEKGKTLYIYLASSCQLLALRFFFVNQVIFLDKVFPCKIELLFLHLILYLLRPLYSGWIFKLLSWIITWELGFCLTCNLLSYIFCRIYRRHRIHQNCRRAYKTCCHLSSTPHRHSTTHLSHELVNLCLYGCKLDDARRIFNKDLWNCKLVNLIYALTCEFVVCHDIYIYCMCLLWYMINDIWFEWVL